MLIGHLNPFAFILALGLGMLVTYMTVPPPSVVIKFPTPFNAGKVVYTGEAGEDCYKYVADVVDCDDYAGSVRPQPLTLGAEASASS